MSKLQGLLFGLATLVLVVLATFYFTKPWLPALRSDRGAIDDALALTLLVTGAVFIVTNLLLAWFGWRYQDHPGAQASYWHDDPKLEWTWTLATAGILAIFLFKALNLWASVQSTPPKDAMVVEVTGQQFRWLVRYPGPDGVFGKTDVKNMNSDNEKGFLGLDPADPASADDVVLNGKMVLATDRPVRVRIRSTDVIHSFFLPNFRVKQDAMPGMTIETWFTPKAAGEYELACAELCGLGHYRMRGDVRVVAQAEFDQALAKAAEE